MQTQNTFDFKTYVNSLTSEELDSFADASGTTSNYIIKKLRYRYTKPSVSLLKKMADASDGKLTFQQLLDWFYPPEPVETA